MRDLFKNRYFMLVVFFILLGALIVVRLVDLQIVHGKEIEEISKKRVLKDIAVEAQRGSILDRNGIPIAINRQGFKVDIINAGLDEAELNDILLKLSDVFKKNGDKYNSALSQYLTVDPISFGNKTNEQIESWQMDPELFKIKAKDLMKIPADFFTHLRKKQFKIDEKYDIRQTYDIMVLRYEILKSNWIFDTGGTICLASDVCAQTVAELEERHHEFPGVTTSIVPVRKYIDAEPLAHLLGFIRPIDAGEYAKLNDEGYGPNDLIGKLGVEYSAERYLRGTNGQKRIEVNTEGRLINEISGVPAIPGHDVVLTIDTNLQAFVLKMLEDCITDIREGGRGGKKNFKDANAGSVIVMDVNTGELLAMVNYPTYDPSIFLADSSDKEAQDMISYIYDDSNPDKPALNRAIQGQYAPGSTYKPITAIAGLEEGVITPDSVIRCTGHTNIGNKDFWCLEYRTQGIIHGNLRLKRALETSCNIYFHELGFMTGIDNVEKWAKYFGLGEYTGIDIPGEYKGVRAGQESKTRIYNDIWRPADTAQTAIGQFNNAFTPIQMVRYIAALANGGKLYRPHVIKSVIRYDGSIVNETIPEYNVIPVSEHNMQAVRDGMISVVHSEEGTASSVFGDFPMSVAGKTGTAETGQEADESSNALFACYAPADKPEIAVVVVVEKGVWGSYTAPVAKAIIEEYFSLKKSDGSDSDSALYEAVFTR